MTPLFTAMAILLTITAVVLYAQPRLSTQSRACLSADDQERIRALSYEAADVAFKLHIEKLFDTWMRSVNDPTALSRARTGTQHGILAYAKMREDARNWTPEQC